MTDEQTGPGEIATTLRPLAPEEAERWFLMPAPEHDYSFYVLDPPPSPDGWIAEGQWIGPPHEAGWSVLGVWEMRHDPLLLRVRPLWIEREQVERQQFERQQIEREWLQWPTAAADPHQDLTWKMPFQPLKDATSSFWGTPREMQALVTFLSTWLGTAFTPQAGSAQRHFSRREGDWFAEPPDLEDDPEFDDSDPWLSDEPIGEPPEDMAPWPPEEADRWEPDAPTFSLPDEAPDWEPADPQGMSASPDEPLSPWAWDPEELYFGEPSYTYIPSLDVPAESELAIVCMPTWQRADEGVTWGGRPRLRQDPQLGLVVADAFSVVSHRLEDLRDPDFDPYLEVGVGYIDLDRPALQELLELLQQHIDEYVHRASKATRTDSEDKSS